MLGRILCLEAALLVLPAAVAAIYRESTLPAFALSIAISTALGLIMVLASGKREHIIFAKDGLITTALAWLLMSLVGALPFYISGEIPSLVDAFFETVSGFTTTGASILSDVEQMSRGMLFWRSFTHWCGGMGVIVLMMAIMPSPSGRAMHIMRAEMPGPTVGKLVPRVRDTAKILYLIYIALTLCEILFLWAGDMNLFESIVHSLGTAGTGGFGIKHDSVGSYSAYSQWVITVFMLIFGVNFNLYFLILARKLKSALKSEEMRAYFILVAVASAAIAVNTLDMFDSLADAIRTSTFQVASIITTTGYSTVDFNLWPGFSKAILFILMFFGGCAGSTAGGIKLSRIIMMLKTVANDLRRLAHPRAVTTVSFEGKTVDETTKRGVGEYLMLYLFVFGACFLAVSLDSFDFETNFTAVATCINNVGPGFAAVGPASSFADYSAFSKLVLSAAMLLGRLEFYPLLLAALPATWTRRG